jgi:3',5'-cyclic AMP phosphodiesterase CpdA
MFTLAHLSDPHLGPLPRPRLVELASKRAIGFLNWHRRRKTIHRGEILEPLVADLKAQSPDHIALTGDLVNIALPSEFSSSRVWLDKLGAADDVTFVPGNHDFYIRRATHQPHSHWGDFMRGDEGAPDEFPFLRRRGPLALIGLSSAVPTPLFMATGLLGDAQLARLAALLERLAGENLLRVVLIHHPPVSKPIYRFKRLLDSGELRAILKTHGADLVLHGHDHLHSVVYLDGPKGKIPTIGVPSASAAGGEEDPAAYNLYRIERATDDWRCEAITRGFRRGQDTIGELTRRMLIEA